MKSTGNNYHSDVSAIQRHSSLTPRPIHPGAYPALSYTASQRRARREASSRSPPSGLASRAKSVSLAVPVSAVTHGEPFKPLVIDQLYQNGRGAGGAGRGGGSTGELVTLTSSGPEDGYGESTTFHRYIPAGEGFLSARGTDAAGIIKYENRLLCQWCGKFCDAKHADTCEKRVIRCPLCNVMQFAPNYAAHYEACEEYVISETTRRVALRIEERAENERVARERAELEARRKRELEEYEQRKERERIARMVLQDQKRQLDILEAETNRQIEERKEKKLPKPDRSQLSREEAVKALHSIYNEPAERAQSPPPSQSMSGKRQGGVEGGDDGQRSTTTANSSGGNSKRRMPSIPPKNPAKAPSFSNGKPHGPPKGHEGGTDDDHKMVKEEKATEEEKESLNRQNRLKATPPPTSRPPVKPPQSRMEDKSSVEGPLSDPEPKKPCPHCKAFIPIAEYEMHVKKLCQKKKLRCSQCGATITKAEVKAHRQTCPAAASSEM